MMELLKIRAFTASVRWAMAMAVRELKSQTPIPFFDKGIPLAEYCILIFNMIFRFPTYANTRKF